MIEIIIGIGDGTPYPISIPEGVRLVIRDYDVPDDWGDVDDDEQPDNGGVRIDAEGQRYQEIALP
jgi:hypothetical protein